MDTEFIEIDSSEDLLLIAQNPEGSYILTSDIDMSGVEWKPFEFSGTLDGNGHAILNLTITETGDETAVTYDGNMKEYDTYFSGFFSSITDATITNLTILNEKIEINNSLNCTVGGFAGFSENSTISDCTLLADIRLTSSGTMVGVGGAVGYGNGLIANSTIDTTLVFTDSDDVERNEQFMGGVLSAGYMDIDGCNVTIDGYDSDQGYVHNGGLIGMYILYPSGTEYAGYINNNSLTGKITFFENNTNRRAYCDASIGEVLNWTFVRDNNSYDFTADERLDYSTILLPEMCENPVYNEVITAAGCNTYGYTTYTCENCGYSFNDNYTLFSHNYGKYSVTIESTPDSTGISTRVCEDCGAIDEDVIPVLEPNAVETESLTVAESATGSDVWARNLTIAAIAISVIALAMAVIFTVTKRRKNNG